MDANHRHFVGIDLKIHLGVIDVPEPLGNTTFGVGTILEEKYGLFSAFADNNAQFMADAIANDVAGAMETYLMTGEFSGNPFAGAGDKISQRMREFISLQEVERLGIPGVPTQAALEGKTLRKKKVGKKGKQLVRSYGPRRPSFIDSGTLEKSLKAWID